MNISSIFDSVLEISIISSIIGIVIILLRQLLKDRVNSKWIYIIWFILLFKLLVPIKIESIVSIFNFTPKYIAENNYIENSKIEYENLEQEYNNYINYNIDESNDIVNNQESYELKQLEQEMKNSKIKNNILEHVIPTIWIIGTIIMVLWLIITNIVLNLKLNKNCYKDERLENVLEKCKNKINVKRNFNIVINDIISTPALFGIFKVKILIPKEILKLSDENLEYILLHELSHYKRKDVCINYLILFIQSIHWFNPIIWLCFKLFRNDLELATDEYALKYLDENKYKSYANALVETLSISINSKFTPSLIGMVDNKENIKRRIIMIKTLEIFKKKKVVITLICIIILLTLSVVLLTTPITSDTPNDEFYIFNLNNENKINMGAFKWKYILGESITSTIEPIEYLESVESIKATKSQKINIINKDGNITNIKNVEIDLIKDNINVLNVNNVDNELDISFIAPDDNGIYYYLMKVNYINESYVEYLFKIEIKDENIVEDTSKKVGNLINNLKWNKEKDDYDYDIVRDITENELNKILDIYERAQESIAYISFAKLPDYSLSIDGKRTYDIRIANNLITMKIYDKGMTIRTIYLEDDVKYLLEFLGEENKYASLPIIDLNEYNKPMDVYWYGGTKFELGTYGWNISTDGNLSNLVIADSISPKEILKDKKAVDWLGIQGSYISIYSKDEGINKKLPKETVVKYKIYSVNESENNAQYKEATRMIDGSYYLSEFPVIKGEYIVEVYISFCNLSNNNAHYCLKYKS